MGLTALQIPCAESNERSRLASRRRSRTVPEAYLDGRRLDCCSDAAHGAAYPEATL